MSLPAAAAFDGSSYLSRANYTGNPAAFSVACWANPLNLQASRVFFGNFAGGPGWAVGISDSTNNRVKFYLGSATLEGVGTIPAGAWSFLVFTHDGTTARIYLDGAATPNATLASGVNYGSAPANNYIGSLNGSAQNYNGWLAGVGYWSKALTATEVATLHNGGAGLLASELSGTLTTGLGSYHDFGTASNLGLDGSAAGRVYAAGAVTAPATGVTAAPGPAYVAPVLAGFAKPTAPALQPGNALASGLVRCGTIQEPAGSSQITDYASGANHLATRQAFATSTALARGVDPTYGTYLTFNGTNQDAKGSAAGLPTGKAAQTLAVLARFASVTATGVDAPSGCVAGIGAGGGVGLLLAGFFGTGRPWSAQVNASAVSANIRPTARIWHLMLAVYSGSAWSFYVDDAGGAGNDTSGLAIAAGGNLWLGQIGGTGGPNADGTYGSFCPFDLAGLWAWDRALSSAERASFLASPWQMVTPTTIATAPGKKGGGGKGTQAAYRLGTRTPTMPTPGL